MIWFARLMPGGFRLVLRNARVYLVGPGKDAASKVLHLREASLAKQRHCLGAACSTAAVGHDFAARVQLVHARGKVAQRDEISAEIADLILVWLADVEDEDVIACIELGFQFLGANFRNGGDLRSFLASDTAELVVVDQLVDRGIPTASWAVRVFAQTEFAEVHAECIDQQEAANEWFARAENELDDLGRLDYAEQSGKDSEHAPFGARRHQPGRWRLGIKAAIARAVFDSEDAGLSFEAKDGSVNVGPARKHTGIIYQVSGREVVGAIGNDVELTKQVERVSAAEPGFELANVDEGIHRSELLRG